VEEAEIKTITSRLICCCTVLRNVSAQQLYSCIALLNQFIVMQRHLNSVKIMRCAISFSTQSNLQHLMKMSTFGTYECFKSCTPLVNGCVNCALLNAVPNAYTHTGNWKESVMQQRNITIMSWCRCQEEKNKQIKTHETDAAWHGSYYSR